MKKFITILIATMVAMVVYSPEGKAQYRYAPDSTYNQRLSELLNSPEYQNASMNERKGKTLFYTGLGCQVVGAALLFVPISTTRDYYDDYGHFCSQTDSTGFGTICNIVGAASAVAGSVMEIVGICKWCNGISEKRDLRIMYSVGGLQLVF